MLVQRALAVILLFLLLCQNACADGLADGQRPIDFCVRITNLGDYPGKVFVIFQGDDYTSNYTLPSFGYIILKDARCIPQGNKHVFERVYSIDKVKFDEKALIPMVMGNPWEQGRWDVPSTYVNDSNRQMKYVTDNFQLVPVVSDGLIQSRIDRVLSTNDYDPTARIVYDYKLVETDGGLAFERTVMKEGINWAYGIAYLVFFIVFTSVVESIVIYNLVPKEDMLKKIFLINSITVPLGFILLNLSLSLGNVEVLIVLLEIPLFKKLFNIGYMRAAGASLIANVVSYMFGLLFGSIGLAILVYVLKIT